MKKTIIIIFALSLVLLARDWAMAAIAAPGNVAVAITPGVARADISWSPVSGAASYYVYRSTYSGSRGSFLADVNTANYADEGLNFDTDYYYQIVAKGEAGSLSADSAAVVARPYIPAPQNVTAEDTAAGGTIKISWQRPTFGLALTYTVYRSTSLDSLGSQVASRVAGTEYLDERAQTGTQYYYRVRSINEAGYYSPQSNAAYAVATDTIAPAAPTGLSLTFYDGTARLYWRSSTNERMKAFRVYRSSSPSDEGSQLGEVNYTSFTDSTVPAAGTYYYRVRAIDEGNNFSVASEPAVLERLSEKLVASEIESAKAEATGKNGEILLSWTNPADRSFAYARIYRNTVSGSLGSLVADKVRGQSYLDRGLRNGLTYHYVFRSVSNLGVESRNTQELDAAPYVLDKNSTPPPAPYGLMVHDQGDGKTLVLEWKNPDPREYDSVKIYRSETRGVFGKPIATGLRASAYQDTEGIAQDSVFYYLVRSVDSLGRESTNGEQVRGIATLSRNGDIDNDPDGDGLDTDWERRYGFHPYLADFTGSDDDYDGLTLYDEMRYGSNPWLSDTDNDGYSDGTEVLNGYNPAGPGRLAARASVRPEARSGSFAYGRARTSDIKEEQGLATELKAGLEVEFRSARIPSPLSHWSTLVNAYVYGGYSIQEIAHTLRYGPGLVHPSIPAAAWRNSGEYTRRSGAR